MSVKDGKCCSAPAVAGVEYAYGSPERYDGISEWACGNCGTREGKWSGNILAEGEIEPRFGGEDARS